MTDADVISAIGEAGMTALVAGFYRRVRADDLLGPLYPPDDFEAAEVRLRDFLIQRFGGSDRYSQARGHPRLRMRHAPFAIGPLERDRWLELMGQSMAENQIPPDVDAVLWPYFVQTAGGMMNTERGGEWGTG